MDDNRLDEPLTPEQRVFGTLHNLQKIAQCEDMNANRERILHMLDRALSWEGELASMCQRIQKPNCSA